jgi:hypothetical protein
VENLGIVAHGASEAEDEQRKKRRFPVREPASVKVHREVGWEEVQGITENVSLRGVLLITDSPLPIGSEVEIALTLELGGAPSVTVYGRGKVVRTEPRSERTIAVGIQCELGFAQVP